MVAKYCTVVSAFYFAFGQLAILCSGRAVNGQLEILPIWQQMDFRIGLVCSTRSCSAYSFGKINKNIMNIIITMGIPPRCDVTTFLSIEAGV